MKRILLYFLLITMNVILFLGNPILCLAEEAETTLDKNQLYAQSAVLMDADSGRVLYEKSGETILPMASTTKIMTCILTLEYGNTEDAVEVSSYAASMPKVKLGISAGETYRLKDLLYSLMLESHNDSAVAIAEHIGGSVEGFAERMNQKAEEIGCEHTCFITPNGLDAQKELKLEDGSTTTVMHSTTARDLALIMSYCIKKSPQKEEFLEITRTASHSFTNIKGNRSFSCTNHNAFLNMMDGALSGKTGFTGKAGYCYVGALERDGRTFVVALLACGWPNNKTYKWSDTKKLMKYGIANYQLKDLSEEAVDEKWLSDISVSDAKTDTLYGEAQVGVYMKEEKEAPVMLMKQGESAEVTCSVQQHLNAPVAKDQEVGTIQYHVDGSLVWERKLCTKEALEKVDFAWFFQIITNNYLLLSAPGYVW